MPHLGASSCCTRAVRLCCTTEHRHVTSALAERLETLRADARSRLAGAADANAVEAIRHELLGRSGELTALLRSVGEAPAEERPALGRLANEVRAEIEAALAARLAEVTAGALDAQLEAERLDMTAPGEPVRIGHLHPTHSAERDFREWLPDGAFFHRYEYGALVSEPISVDPSLR